MKAITIKDIAKALNVSVATVSRSLRNHPDVNEVTRKMVLEKAKDMDYHPNLMASSLSSRKSKIIGVVVPTINRGFWSNAISGIEEETNKRGYKVMICQSCESSYHENENLEILANSRVDGILLAISKNTISKEKVESILSRGIPILLFERIFENIECNKVRTDDFNGSYTATSHLIKSGCRRIAYFMGYKSLNVCEERLRGYIAAIKDHGLVVDKELIVETSFEREEVKIDFVRFYTKTIEKPDGIFCFADVIAIGVVLGARKLNLRIPEDFSLIGFGDDDVSSLITPSLTTMRQPSFEMGEKSASILINEIAEKSTHFVTEKFTPTLIIRNSTKN
jgi:LacI family transcriptional regulator